LVTLDHNLTAPEILGMVLDEAEKRTPTGDYGFAATREVMAELYVPVSPNGDIRPTLILSQRGFEVLLILYLC